MAIPADLTDFAVGFSLNEGIVSAARDIESLDIIETDGTCYAGGSAVLRPLRFGSGPLSRLSIERKAERTRRRADLVAYSGALEPYG